MSSTAPSNSAVIGRSCSGCTLCCKLLSIRALSKPRQKWCPHCTAGVGCNIYIARPTECQTFLCEYLHNEDLGEEWYPANCKMVLHYEAHANRIVIHVDAGRIDAWRKEPYYSQIKSWARKAIAYRGQVIVWQGTDAVAVLPNREKNLGRVRDDQFIVTAERRSAGGVDLDVLVVEKDDPRIQGSQLPTHELDQPL